MSRKSGKEMRALMLAVSASVLLLILAVIAFFMVNTILTMNENIARNKELVIEQSFSSLTEIGFGVESLVDNPRVLSILNQDIIESILGGDKQAFYDFVGDFSTLFYPIDYISVIKDGEIVSYGTKPGLEVDPREMPTESSAELYETQDRLGGREGTFVSIFYRVDLDTIGLGEVSFNMIVDRSKEVAEVEEYFKGQRNDLVLRLSIVSVIAVILSLLLTTLGLRYFTRKYVVNPIEELNRTAEAIADGTYQGEVQVDEGSAYAALLGLLRSGQKVLSRMDEEARD